MLGEGGIGRRGGDGSGEWRRRSGRRWWLGVAAQAADYEKEPEMALVKCFIGRKNRRKERKEIKN
jgi:hypothetical protein